MGTIALEGPDFGRCSFTKLDGTGGVLDGGVFHILQARAAEPECRDDSTKQKELASGLQVLLDFTRGVA